MSTLKANNFEHLDATTASVQTTVGGGTILTGISTCNSRLVVGGTDTSATLNVFGGDVQVGTGLTIKSSSSGGNITLAGGFSFPGGWIRLNGGSSTDSITFGTSGTDSAKTERMRLNASGHLGIGTNNPTGTAALTNNTATLAVGIATVGALHVNSNPIPSAGALSNRNLLINGAMNVSQRNTSFTITSNVYTLDRHQAIGSGGFSWDSATVSQSSDAPDGFNNSLRVDVNTVQTPSGGGNALIRHQMEAQDLQCLAFGTSEAKSFTVSFWVKSDKTGTYCLQICQDDATKYQLKEYTVSNSWERKKITFEANTADSIADDNGRGFDLRFHLACGPDDHHSATTSWVAGNTYRATSNQVNLFDNASNNFRITGIQLEMGDVATPFEYRSYGDELAKCERYYQQSYKGTTPTGNNGGTICATCCGNTNRAFGNVYWSTTMRQAPTVTWFAGSNGTQDRWRNNSQGTDITAATPNSAIGDRGYGFVLSSGISAVTDTLVGHYTADAEL